MKVYIGSYKNWIGPYQIANLLKYVGFDEDKCDSIGQKLSNIKFLTNFLNWIDKNKKRTIKIKIDDYDTWSADDTLARIIVPLLHQFKADNHGSPLVDDHDVPDEIKSTSAPAKQNEWDTDQFFHQRWEYVIDEMIFAFEHIVDQQWEDQYRTGVIDYNFVKQDDGTLKMVEGPNHSFKLDQEKYNQINSRINNGTRLFGKYFRSLWT